MCGLWAYFLEKGKLSKAEAARQRHWMHAVGARGPDSYVEVVGANYHLGFHRLAIRDVSHLGDQPFVYTNPEDGVTIHLMCNGEIYNYSALVTQYNLRGLLRSQSDCEVLVHLLVHFRYDLARALREVNGEYAVVVLLTDAGGSQQVMAARDPFGVRPLYVCQNDRAIGFSSLVTGLAGLFPPGGASFAAMAGAAPAAASAGPGPKKRKSRSAAPAAADKKKAVTTTPGASRMGAAVEHVPPGSVMIRTAGKTLLVSFYDVRTEVARQVPAGTPLPVIYRTVCDALVRAVRVRLTADRPIGFLLSGGLDSSLVVAIAAKLVAAPMPQTFSIGMATGGTGGTGGAGVVTSSDLAHARRVADHLGIRSGHTEVTFTAKEGLDAIYEVVRVLETYDITTIRASVGQYLLARYISQHTDIRVILNGDGADELAGGYLYFHGAPSADEAHEESQRLLREIHLFDSLRVDRTLGAHGLEARVPFLDTDLVRCYHSVPAGLRAAGAGRREKQLLRDAFQHCYPDLLPREVLYRTKEAFSDGVSGERSWYQVIQDWAEELVTDEEFRAGAKRYAAAGKPIRTKEAYLYRDIFESFFPGQEGLLPHYWMPRWSPGVTDPSARCLPTYAGLQGAA